MKDLKENPEKLTATNLNKQIINKEDSCTDKTYNTKAEKEGEELKNEKQIEDLRILLRFNCRGCSYNYSKITNPSIFNKKCKDCNGTCCLVVLRCNVDTLYGGYICLGCNCRFLTGFDFLDLESVTPLCSFCNLYTKVYQILLNKSKICIKNIKMYTCSICNSIHYDAYYNRGKAIVNDTIISKNIKSKYSYNQIDKAPYCCKIKMDYWKLKREFTFIQLDNNGNSPSYYNNLKFVGDNYKTTLNGDLYSKKYANNTYYKSKLISKKGKYSACKRT